MHRLFLFLALSLQLLVAGQLFAQSTEDPSPDQFVDVQDEPKPLVPLEQLIVYPEAAKKAGLEGKVIVQILIEKDGSVSKVEVLKSDYDVFKEPAIDAMKRAKFSPALSENGPVRIWYTQTINFKLLETQPVDIDPPDYSRFGAQIGVSLDSARSWLRTFGQVEQVQQDSKILLRTTAKPDTSRMGDVSTRLVSVIVGEQGVEEVTFATYFNTVEYATRMIGRSERSEYDRLEPGRIYHVNMDSSNRVLSYRARRQ